MPEELKVPAAYSNEVYARGLAYQRPAITFDSTQWEPLAKEKLSAESWAYVYGNAGRAETRDKNLAAFRKWSIVPSRLHGAGLPNLETTVLGQKLPFPIALAPVGVQKIFHRDGESATASAAAKEHVPYIHSTAAATSIEAAAAANESGTRWFQLYWPGNDYNDLTISMLQRAKREGYTALFVTLDTYTLGWRPMDMDNAYNPFIKADEIGSANGFSDPVFRARFAEQNQGKAVEENVQAACVQWLAEVFSPINHSWEDLAFLQQHWDGPIVLKGIQSVVDAKKAVDAGVQGILVSNHGGRQQDGGAGSLDMLPAIAAAVQGKLEIFFDSGVRCGADIIKALALGADMVLVGRPYVYGLALGGESGVRHVTRAMLGDLQLTMHLSGIKSVDKKDLNRDCAAHMEIIRIPSSSGSIIEENAKLNPPDQTLLNLKAHHHFAVGPSWAQTAHHRLFPHRAVKSSLVSILADHLLAEENDCCHLRFSPGGFMYSLRWRRLLREENLRAARPFTSSDASAYLCLDSSIQHSKSPSTESSLSTFTQTRTRAVQEPSVERDDCRRKSCIRTRRRRRRSMASQPASGAGKKAPKIPKACSFAPPHERGAQQSATAKRRAAASKKVGTARKKKTGELLTTRQKIRAEEERKKQAAAVADAALRQAEQQSTDKTAEGLQRPGSLMIENLRKQSVADWRAEITGTQKDRKDNSLGTTRPPVGLSTYVAVISCEDGNKGTESVLVRRTQRAKKYRSDQRNRLRRQPESREILLQMDGPIPNGVKSLYDAVRVFEKVVGNRPEATKMLVEKGALSSFALSLTQRPESPVVDVSGRESSLLKLASAVRIEIIKLVVVETNFFISPSSVTGKEQPDLAMVNRTLRAEVLPIFYSLNTFRIELGPYGSIDAQNPLAIVQHWITAIGPAWINLVKTWAFTYDEERDTRISPRSPETEDGKVEPFCVSIRLGMVAADVSLSVHREAYCILSGQRKDSGQCVKKAEAPEWLVKAARLLSTKRGEGIVEMARLIRGQISSVSACRCEGAESATSDASLTDVAVTRVE
nr:putative lactate 2-monooxygenase pb1a11.03 [Quercus suber]